MEQLNVPEEMKVVVKFDDYSLPESVKLFRPLLYQEGDQYCCILGPDPQQGVFGCGETAESALEDWDKNLQDRLQYHSGDDEVARYMLDTMKATVNKIQ